MIYWNYINRESPDDLVVKIPGFHCSGSNSNPVWELSFLKPQCTVKTEKKKKLYNTKYIIKKVIKNNIKGKYNGSDKGSHFPFIKR